MTKSAGFSCIIKESFTDFIVREVNDDGEIAVLREAGDPSVYREKMMQTLSSTAGVTVSRGAYLTGGEDMSVQSELRKLLDQPSLMALAEFLEWARDGDMTVLPAPVCDKAQRTAVHMLLKQHLPQLSSDTMQLDEPPQVGATVKGAMWGARGASGASTSPDAKPYIRVRMKTFQDLVRLWPKGRPHHARMVLAKVNSDTISAMDRLARSANTRTKFLGYAGTKDRRAMTAQWITASLINPYSLSLVNSSNFGDGSLLRVGDFDYVPKQMQLGQLSGNRFFLTLRQVQAGPGPAADQQAQQASIDAALVALREWVALGASYVNYFGLQRFGTGSVSTSALGQLLLQGKFAQCAAGMLKMQEVIPLELLQAIDAGDEDSAAAAAEKLEADFPPGAIAAAMPGGFYSEVALLRGIDRAGWKGVSSAYGSIPMRARSLLVHAYQSLLWNKMATARLALGTQGAIEGDLVLVDASAKGDEGEAEEEGPPSTPVEGGTPVPATSGKPLRPWPPVRHVTAQEAAAGTFSMEHVVLPIPGAETAFPTHAAGAQLYCQLLSEDGFEPALVAVTLQAAGDLTGAVQAAMAAGGPTTDGFVSMDDSGSGGQSTMRHPAVAKHRDHPVWGRRSALAKCALGVLTGGYRSLLAAASDPKWLLVRHTEAQTQLYPTELDAPMAEAGARPASTALLADGLVVRAPAAGAGGDGAPWSTTPEGGVVGEGGFLSLALEFTLPSGAYATMALRELLKITSATAQHHSASKARVAAAASSGGDQEVVQGNDAKKARVE